MDTAETVFESWLYPLFLYGPGQAPYHFCASLHICKTGLAAAFTFHGALATFLVAMARCLAKGT